MPLLFQVITGLPLDAVNPIEDSDSFGLWNNLGTSIDQVVPGNLDDNFSLGSSENAGYDIFASDIPGKTDGIGSQLEESIFSNNIDLISADYTDTSPAIPLTEGNSQNEISKTPGCTNQARKRRESGDILLGSVIISNRS
jgi:hypothetical protein